MIEIVSGTPTDEELAAIIAALSAACHPEQSERSERRRGTTSIWGMAGRQPDLEIDDLRVALRQAQGDTVRVF